MASVLRTAAARRSRSWSTPSPVEADNEMTTGFLRDSEPTVVSELPVKASLADTVSTIRQEPLQNSINNPTQNHPENPEATLNTIITTDEEGEIMTDYFSSSDITQQ